MRALVAAHHVCQPLGSRYGIQLFQHLALWQSHLNQLGVFANQCQSSEFCGTELHALMRASIPSTRSSSRSVTKLMATPLFPARAVRPTLCVYSSGSCGRSQLITIATSSISSPRPPTSVEIKTGTTHDRKSDRDDRRSRCVRRECSAVLRIDSVLSTAVRYAAVRGRLQNIIVGGGCTGGSSSSIVFVGLFLLARPF